MKIAKQNIERRMRSCSLAQSGDDGNKALPLLRCKPDLRHISGVGGAKQKHGFPGGSC
jgi:hypothetical protein